MSTLTTADALCRHVTGFTDDGTVADAHDRIAVCRRCPLLDACQRCTNDQISRGIGPRGIVQDGISWDINGHGISGSGTCKRGHAMTPENARPPRKGHVSPECRACLNLSKRARRAHRTIDEQWAYEQQEAA